MSKENKLLIMIKSNCLLLMTSQQPIINYETTNFPWRIQLPSASLSRFRALNSMKVTKVPSKYFIYLCICFNFSGRNLARNAETAVEFFKLKIFQWACKFMKVCIVGWAPWNLSCLEFKFDDTRLSS